MRIFRHIFTTCIILSSVSCLTEPAASAQVTQIVKDAAKKAGKIFGKKAAREVIESVGKKAAKEAAEAAGKKATKEAAENAGKMMTKEAAEVAERNLAKEGFFDVSRELTEKAIKENAGKALSNNAKKEISERVFLEVTPDQVRKTLAKNVAKNVGKEASIIFREKVVTAAVRSGDDIAAQFAKRMGSSEAKEAFENSAKQGLRHSSQLKAVENIGVKKRVESRLLSTKIKKTAIHKELTDIQAKGAIRLSEKEYKALLENPNYLRSYIQVKTGDKKNFQEFFIRLAMGDKKQAQAIMEIPWVKEYLKKSIRAGGVHEWLMTKNFQEFLLNPKWGEDGPFLSLALTKFVQNTKNINFKPKSIYGIGGHPASGRINSTASIMWHNDLSNVISKCNTKEELFISIKHFAKETLMDESYREFCVIFTSLFKPIP